MQPGQDNNLPPTVLMIAPARSYRVASYIQAAQKMGYQLTIVSDSEHSLVPAIASGITVDFSRPEQALKQVLSSISEQNIVTIISTDDAVVTFSSQLAQHLGLPHNDPQAALLTYRKDLARECLQASGCNVPEFRILPIAEAESLSEEIHYPVVLKPLMLSGSRGVIRANNPAEFIKASSIIEAIVITEKCESFEKEHLLVETYLEGEEIAIDGFIQNGQWVTLALFDKPEALTGPYFEESYYLTPSHYNLQTQEAIIEEVTRCCQAYGLTHGPIHAEARLTDQGVVLIELASRTIGGQCSQLIDYVTGMPLEQIIIQLMSMQPLVLKDQGLFAGVLMIPITQTGILKRVEGITQALKIPFIEDLEIHIQPGYELIPLPQGASYLGFIFARAPSYADTYEALRSAYSCLDFITTPKWDLEVTDR